MRTPTSDDCSSRKVKIVVLIEQQILVTMKKDCRGRHAQTVPVNGNEKQRKATIMKSDHPA